MDCFWTVFSSSELKPRQNCTTSIDVFQFTLRAFWFDNHSVIGDTLQILIKQNTPAETEHNDHPVCHTVCTQCQNMMFSGASNTDEKNKGKSVEKWWQMERTRGKCSSSRKFISSMWHVHANKRLGVHASGVGSHTTWTKFSLRKRESKQHRGGVRIQADRERMPSRKSFTPVFLPSRGVAPEGISSGHTESHRTP